MSAIFSLLASLVKFYYVLVLIRILLTWIPSISPSNSLVQVLHQVTDPVLEQARRIIPPLGMIDISAMVVLIVLIILSNILGSMA